MKRPFTYKQALCQLIEDLGGEVAIPKDALNQHHILHYFEDKDEVIIVSEVKNERK